MAAAPLGRFRRSKRINVWGCDVLQSLQQVGLTPIRLILIAAGFISVYFGFTIIGNRVHEAELQQQNQQLELRITDAQNQYARLQAVRDWMQSDAFIEAMARRQGMIRPGDHPVLVAAPTVAAETNPTGEWWERYLEPQSQP